MRIGFDDRLRNIPGCDHSYGDAARVVHGLPDHGKIVKRRITGVSFPGTARITRFIVDKLTKYL